MESEDFMIKMKTQKRLWSIGLYVAASLFAGALAETLFFDDFENGLDTWPDLPTLKVEEEPGNPDNHVLVFDTTNDNQNVDALFLEGFEDLADYTMRAKFNIVGETVIDDVEVYDKDGSSLAVDTHDKLAITWGSLKRGRYTVWQNHRF